MMLRLEKVCKDYPGRKAGLFGRAPAVPVLKNVDFAIARGESFGLVGESGSGKTTLTRCILQLEPVASGKVVFDGIDLATLDAKAMRRMRARIQIVFQDPYASLDPRMTVHDTIAEPMVIHQDSLGLKGAARTDRVVQLLELTGLGPQHLWRHPHEFSGGQRQRIGIARALACRPDLVILDEPTSALDVSVQAQILNLLHDLQGRLGLTYLFISHDLGVVRYFCDRVAVIRRGEIVEQGSAQAVFDAPASDYAKALLAAMPDIDPAKSPYRTAT